MEKLERPLPVRVTLVALNVALFVFVVIAIGKWDAPAPELMEGLMWISGVVGASILGDTWRPSGRIPSEAPAESIE